MMPLSSAVTIFAAQLAFAPSQTIPVAFAKEFWIAIEIWQSVPPRMNVIAAAIDVADETAAQNADIRPTYAF